MRQMASKPSRLIRNLESLGSLPLYNKILDLARFFAEVKYFPSDGIVFKFYFVILKQNIFGHIFNNNDSLKI